MSRRKPKPGNARQNPASHDTGSPRDEDPKEAVEAAHANASPMRRGVFLLRDRIGFRVVEVEMTDEEIDTCAVNRTEPDVLPISLAKAEHALARSTER